MSVLSLDSDDRGWDRACLDISSKMAEPFCQAWGLARFQLAAPLDPEKFQNAATRIGEIAKRTLIVIGALFVIALTVLMPLPILCVTVALGLGSKVFRAIGFALQKKGFTHILGDAPEQPIDGKVKITAWNICGIGGGMHFDHGGVNDWRLRIDGIVEQILNEDTDVLILQEIYDTALAEALIEKLRAHYAHFFAHLGPNVWGSVGGVMVITRCPVHTFENTSFANNTWSLNRGFATLELKASPEAKVPCVRVIGTHLIHGGAPEDDTKRLSQLAQIVDSVAQKTLALPTVIGGDLNMERDKKGGANFSAYMHHGYLGEEPTCTNRLVSQWDPKLAGEEEIIDYISLFRSTLADGRQLPVIDDPALVRMEDCHLVRAFDKTYNTKTARSDHHGLSLTLSMRPDPI